MSQPSTTHVRARVNGEVKKHARYSQHDRGVREFVRASLPQHSQIQLLHPHAKSPSLDPAVRLHGPIDFFFMVSPGSGAARAGTQAVLA
jgi:hypothetical protein